MVRRLVLRWTYVIWDTYPTHCVLTRRPQPNEAIPQNSFCTMDDPLPRVLKFPNRPAMDQDPIVITGIGVACSLGSSTEQVWQEIQRGTSGVRLTREEDHVGSLRLPCAMVDWMDEHPVQQRLPGSIKSIQLSDVVAEQALVDADIDWDGIDRERFACSIAAQFGDIGYMYMDKAERNEPSPDNPRSDWWKEFLPCTASGMIASRYGLHGPRLCHTTACASGLVSTITGARMIQSGQADFALCGATDAVTELVFSAFHRMGVLSTGPDVKSACRPFDVDRNGFVMGEGGAMMVLEKRSHAIARGAKIYAELAGSQTLCQAHHVTGLDDAAETLTELIGRLMDRAGWNYLGPQYISAHGTGTEQNDRSELTAIRDGLGDKADDIIISSNKAVLGHMINAAGSIELALTALAMRDSYAPPTMHLETPEILGNIDCLPQAGVQTTIDRAMKLSLAFGGHLVGMALRRCPDVDYQRPAKPLVADALIRHTAPVPRRLAAA